MGITNYYSVGGVLLGEESASSGRLDYVTDALGSVTATVTQSGTVQNTYRYKPYGTQLAKTGTGGDPSFTWVGSQGYRQTNRQYSDIYVRARHYTTRLGIWTTKDPIGLRGGINFFAYVSGSVISAIDPTGMLDTKYQWSSPKEPGFYRGCLPVGPCSDYEYNNAGIAVNWHLIPSGGGQLVQKITRTIWDWDCDNGQLVDDDEQVFWELLPRTSNVYETFCTPTRYRPVRGYVYMTGEVKIFPSNVDITRFKENCGVPNSKNAYCTKDQPTWWSDRPLEGPQTHALYYDYCCCGTKTDWSNVKWTPDKDR